MPFCAKEQQYCNHLWLSHVTLTVAAYFTATSPNTTDVDIIADAGMLGLQSDVRMVGLVVLRVMVPRDHAQSRPRCAEAELTMALVLEARESCS